MRIQLNSKDQELTSDDPTIRKCVKLAGHWGYGGIVVVNQFAWRATDRSEIRTVDHPVGPRNDLAIRTELSQVDDVLAAWGNDGRWLDRAEEVRGILRTTGNSCCCLKQNATGEPAHPLYQKDDSDRQPFRP